jgi:hypothetical protein
MDELDIPFYLTAAGQRSFLYRATKLWNDLDNNIKDILSPSLSPWSKFVAIYRIFRIRKHEVPNP